MNGNNHFLAQHGKKQNALRRFLQPRCRPHSDEHLSAAPPLSWVDRGHQRAIPPRASQRRIFPHGTKTYIHAESPTCKASTAPWRSFAAASVPFSSKAEIVVKIPNTKFVVAPASFKMVLVFFVLRSQAAGEGGGEEEEEKVKSVGRRKWMTHCRPFQG